MSCCIQINSTDPLDTVCANDARTAIAEADLTPDEAKAFRAGLDAYGNAVERKRAALSALDVASPDEDKATAQELRAKLDAVRGKLAEESAARATAEAAVAEAKAESLEKSTDPAR